jgi:hypothetical protein
MTRTVLEINTALRQLRALKYVTLQWEPSHVGIHGNEVADLKKRNYSVQKQPNTGST